MIFYGSKYLLCCKGTWSLGLPILLFSALKTIFCKYNHHTSIYIILTVVYYKEVVDVKKIFIKYTKTKPLIWAEDKRNDRRVSDARTKESVEVASRLKMISNVVCYILSFSRRKFPVNLVKPYRLKTSAHTPGSDITNGRWRSDRRRE